MPKQIEQILKASVISLVFFVALMLAAEPSKNEREDEFDPRGRDVRSTNFPFEVLYRERYFPFETDLTITSCHIHRLPLKRVDVPIAWGYFGNFPTDPLKNAPFGRLLFNTGDYQIGPGHNSIYYVTINRCEECVQILERRRGFTREDVRKFERGKLRQRYPVREGV